MESVSAYSASITTSNSISLDASPANDGTTIHSESINVQSDCRAGYNLTIATPEGSDLYKYDNDTQSATASFTAVDGTSALSSSNNTNKWGYTLATNPTSATIFSPLSTTESILKTTSQTASPSHDIDDTFNINYGIKTDVTIAPGSYKMANNGTILYYLTMDTTCTQYTVSFNANESSVGETPGSATGTMTNQTIITGTSTAIKTSTFALSGYLFYGWNTAMDGTGTFYSDGQTVTNLTSSGNAITLYAVWRDGAYLDTGQNVNPKLKRLAGNSSAAYNAQDTTISAIVRYSSLPSGFTSSSENTISDSTSPFPIYAWYDSEDTTIYYYSKATTILMSKNSSYFFYNMRALSNLSTISTWDTTKVTDMSYMFGSAGYSATTWSVTIPRTNDGTTTGPIANTTSSLYGKTTSTYVAPPSGKSFTLAQP